MEVSSTIIASQASGASSSWKKAMRPVASSNCASRSRWMVEASRPVTSESRFAARPVGAASCVLSRSASNSRRMPDMTVVLPVPGPPVTIRSCREAAARMALRCSGA